MTKRERFFFVGCFAAVLLWPSCNKRISSGPDLPAERAESLLSPGISEAVVVGKSTVAVAKRGKKTKVQYVPPEGSVSVVLPLRGDGVKVRVKDLGFCFSPGIMGGVAGGGARFCVGLTAKLAYKSRFGLETSLLVGKQPAIAFGAGLSYTPAWRLTNTSVVGGWSTLGPFIGVLVRF